MGSAARALLRRCPPDQSPVRTAVHAPLDSSTGREKVPRPPDATEDHLASSSAVYHIIVSQPLPNTPRFSQIREQLITHRV